MTDQAENMPLEELRADHMRMEKQLLESKTQRKTSHFQASLWVKSSGRITLVYVAVLVGLAILSASNVFTSTTGTSSGTMALIATISVTFSILWLTINQES